MKTKILLHKFSKSEQQWKDIESNDLTKPKFNIFQHTITEYKNTIFFIGGITVIPMIEKETNDRYNIPFIPTYNIKENKWDGINWGIYLRAHATVTIGNFLMIHGGIDEEEKFN